MGLRITTWNVNGIRNPFGYQPWREKRSFAAMFDILEADIVVFQETKIQRKDLSDDMVLVPGWDCYFSLPRYKKGYSGVAIYTRQSVCAPIRAEEGITGVLCPPNSSTSFCDLPSDQQIGGYPTRAQLEKSSVDAAALDSEGRAVLLEFPAFVLIGVYSPANRDETRDEYRLGFLNALDARVRNLDAMGKQIFLTGDLNISREELDAANAEASMRKQGLSGFEFVSSPSRRLFNQLLGDGKVFGERDAGREHPILHDICRAFHPLRKGMFTCWEQKVNARPANCGARIDYVLCSLSMKDWFDDSNIQEGLMGSDHCPVYAIFGTVVGLSSRQVHLQDVMNPPDMFVDGNRQRQYLANLDILPTSARLIPEFTGRRNIRDMLTRAPSLFQVRDNGEPGRQVASNELSAPNAPLLRASLPRSRTSQSVEIKSPEQRSRKHMRAQTATGTMNKRLKSTITPAGSKEARKGQQSLQNFLKPPVKESTADASGSSQAKTAQEVDQGLRGSEDDSGHPGTVGVKGEGLVTLVASSQAPEETINDPVESKESWSRLFAKPVAPRCEGHDEPCINLLTKKPGINLGRSFWMCSRPLGPSGTKERNTQWRCQTFIWCSDWNSHERMNVGDTYDAVGQANSGLAALVADPAVGPAL